jgi:cytochrome c553
MAKHSGLIRWLVVSGFLGAMGLSVAQTSAPHVGAKVDLAAQLKAAQANPVQLESFIKSGAKVATFCASCHGDGGNSVKPDVPNLAGQNAAYLLDEMRQFTDGSRKDTEFKQRLIKVLSPQEKIGLNLYYAHQSVTYKPAGNTALAARGQVVYQKECVVCHEADGRGTEDIARVAGQQTVYLTHVLNAYRDGSSRRGDKGMIKSLRGLSEADVAAVVTYVGSMK